MALRALREYAPKTRAAYDKVLQVSGFDAARGTLGDLSQWPESRLSLLRAAVADYGRRHEIDVSRVLRVVPAPYLKRTRRHLPTEEDVQAFFAAKKSSRLRITCDLLVGLGLRIDELLQLERVRVERAIGGTLYFFRKGGREETLPSKYLKASFTAALKLPRAKRLDGKPWERFWEVYSISSPKTAYNTFHVEFSKAAKVTSAPELWSPHVLRHLFATWMIADGAPLPVVQKALGHRHYQTTVQTYVHVDTQMIEKWLPAPRKNR